MEQFLATETLIIELLLIVSLVAIAVRRLRVPYTVALVIVGLLITFQQPVQIDLTPELILALFAPPLIFEAAFHIEFQRLRENLNPILVLAIPGVLLTRLGLTRRVEEKLEFERRHGRLMAMHAARERIEQWYREGTISELTWKQLAPELDQQVQTQLEAQHEPLHQHPALQAEELADAKREGLRAQHAT